MTRHILRALLDHLPLILLSPLIPDRVPHRLRLLR